MIPPPMTTTSAVVFIVFSSRVTQLADLDGSNAGPSRSTICVFAHDCRSAFASAYSGELHHCFAFSAVGNSRMTNRVGDQSPSNGVAVPPRTRYRPPYLAIAGGARSL